MEELITKVFLKTRLLSWWVHRMISNGQQIVETTDLITTNGVKYIITDGFVVSDNRRNACYLWCIIVSYSRAYGTLGHTVRLRLIFFPAIFALLHVTNNSPWFDSNTIFQNLLLEKSHMLYLLFILHVCNTKIWHKIPFFRPFWHKIAIYLQLQLKSFYNFIFKRHFTWCFYN